MTAVLDPATLLPLIAALAVAGALIGFLAGLFGIGGGAISVPVFYEVFLTLGHAPEVAMPMAVGTSLAVIIPTSIKSSLGHIKRGTVDLAVLRLWALPVLAGVVIGSAIARYAAPQVFQLVFVLVAAINATKLLAGGSGWRLRDNLPSKGAMGLWGRCGACLGADGDRRWGCVNANPDLTQRADPSRRIDIGGSRGVDRHPGDLWLYDRRLGARRSPDGRAWVRIACHLCPYHSNLAAHHAVRRGIGP